MTAYQRVKAWRAANKDKVKQQSQRRWLKSKDKMTIQQQAWRKNNINRFRKRDAESHRRQRIINPAAQKARIVRFRAKKLLAQEQIAGRPRPSLCEICNEFNLRIVFDHCHAEGHFRGWICDRCNKTLGHVKDSPEILAKLISYLENDRVKTH